MKRTLVALAVLALASSAFATDNGNHYGQNKKFETAPPVIVTSSPKQGQGQLQRQNQGQTQGQKAYGGAGGKGGAGGSGGTAYGGTGGLGGSAVLGSVSGGDSSNAFEYRETHAASSAASIAIAPTTVCAGTTAAGAQGAAFGISFGTSWTDANCMLLEQVRTTSVILNDKETAAEMMCGGVDAYREARARVGKPCGTPFTKKETGVVYQKVNNSDLYRN